MSCEVLVAPVRERRMPGDAALLMTPSLFGAALPQPRPTASLLPDFRWALSTRNFPETYVEVFA
jgi:hypothetical protein